MDLNLIWYGHRRHPLSLALLPASWLWCAAVMVRRRLYRIGRLETRRAARPVVVVGNLTVGGTGKTPLVLRLAELAVERGFRPAILTRGYAGKASDWPRTVRPDDAPGRVGDEPLLLARHGVCPVIAGPDRVADAELAIGSHGCDLLLCDDGLQHYRLERDIEIAVIDGERELGNGRCLPAGPLREPRGRLGSVDLVIRNGAQVGGHRFELVPGAAVNLRDPELTRPLREFRTLRAAAVAGIGNPGRFFDMLRRHGVLVEEWPYPDHHVFTAEEVAGWPPGPVLMTEKDAVKCAKFAGADHWYCPVRADPDPGFVDALFTKLASIPTRKV